MLSKSKVLIAGFLLMGMQQAYALESVVGHVARAGLGNWYGTADTGIVLLDTVGEGFESSPGSQPETTFFEENCGTYFGPLAAVDVSTATGKAMMGVISSAVATGQRVQLDYELVTENNVTYCEVVFAFALGL